MRRDLGHRADRYDYLLRLYAEKPGWFTSRITTRLDLDDSRSRIGLRENHPGFSAYKAEQVIVAVGAVTEVSPHLQVGTATQVVDVTAEAPQINFTSPDFAPSFNQTAMPTCRLTAAAGLVLPF